MPSRPELRKALRLNVILEMRIPRAPNAEIDASLPNLITERMRWIRTDVVCFAPFVAVTVSFTCFALPETGAEALCDAGGDPPPGFTLPGFEPEPLEPDAPEPDPADRSEERRVGKE